MSLWTALGRVGFWVSLPALYIYLRPSRRTRVLVHSEGKVLVVKPWLGSGKWILPGGGLHRHEDSSVGAARELREETGIILPPSRLASAGTVDYRQHGLRFRYEQFIAELPALLEPVV